LKIRTKEKRKLKLRTIKTPPQKKGEHITGTLPLKKDITETLSTPKSTQNYYSTNRPPTVIPQLAELLR
jgi:hypothetical protein